MIRIQNREQLVSINEVYNVGLTESVIDKLYTISDELVDDLYYITSAKKRPELAIRVYYNGILEIYKVPEPVQEPYYEISRCELKFAYNPKDAIDTYRVFGEMLEASPKPIIKNPNEIKQYFINDLIKDTADFSLWMSDYRCIEFGRFLGLDVDTWEKSFKETTREGIDKVVGVYENVNPPVRLAILACNNLIRSTPDDPNYNWYDPGRYFYIQDKKILFFEDFKPWFPNDFSILTRLLNSNIKAVSNKQIKVSELHLDRQKKNQLEERETSAILEQKLYKKLNAYYKDGTPFQYENISFTKDTIEYEGQVLSGINLPEMIRYLAHTPLLLDFNYIVRSFAQHAVHMVVTSASKLELKIGDVSAEVEYKPSLIYINDRRITRDDAEAVIARATCFTKQADYDDFVESVSKCSLRFHRLFATGILLENVFDSLTGDKVTTKIPVFRKKNKNFLLINKHEYQVKDTNKLIRAQNVKDVASLVSTLTNPEIIVGMKPKDIGYLITDGASAYKKEVEQENEFLKSTMNQFSVEYTTGEFLDNGNTIAGYKVKGGMRNYIIRESDQNVFEVPTGKYLCMVDKNFNEISKTNKIIARIYALSNDSALVKEISTLA